MAIYDVKPPRVQQKFELTIDTSRVRTLYYAKVKYGEDGVARLMCGRCEGFVRHVVPHEYDDDVTWCFKCMAGV